MKSLWAAIWNRKTTLFLLVLGQAVNLYIWQMQSLTNIAYLHINAAFAVAVFTAFALDSAQVQIALAPKTKRLHWIIAIAASLVFLALGVWIAVDVMKDAMHAAFAVGVFMYSWYDALVHIPAQTFPTPTLIQPAKPTRKPRIRKVGAAKTVTTNAAHTCPNCNAPVSKSSWYRVKKRGYCAKCR